MENPEVAWAAFSTEHAYVEEEIYAELQETAHLFDTTDGIHAKWSPDGLLGMLLVFDREEAVDDAQQAFAVWIGSMMGMLRQCMEGTES